MKKILITFLAFAFALTSCEFDKGFEEMNVNPNAAAQIKYRQMSKILCKKCSMLSHSI